ARARGTAGPYRDHRSMKIRLAEIAHARSGDKADWVDFGLFAWNAAGYALLAREVTAARVRAHFAPWLPGDVQCWSLPHILVLKVDEFKLARSLRKTVARFARTPGCVVRIDSAFDRVITACAATPRDGQDGTWIVPDMVDAYRRWHRLGAVHSFETWIEGELA